MKKITITITTIGLLALLSCIQEKNCGGSCSPLSNEELAFICYSGGEKVIFKNDTTNVFDTLYVDSKGTSPVNCSDPCGVPNGSIGASIDFLGGFSLRIDRHNQPPYLMFFGSNYAHYTFVLDVPHQTITVNSITYNDVYSVQELQDSTSIISNGDQLKVPWKIDYSKSKGFIRFYMTDGQTWSKL
ncbi:MAG: hypothetical protein HGB12_07110 [Bacteroidetes bacterium]|nr:hypothetical protein [Bacteroidota bacterium]